jgi:GT2 family glycosyltransferase
VNVIKLNKNMGFNIAINSGIEKSDAKYVLTLNKDTVLPNLLSELIAIAESAERIGSCQPKILSLLDPTEIDTVALAFNGNGDACQACYKTKDKGQYDKVSKKCKELVLLQYFTAVEQSVR